MLSATWQANPRDRAWRCAAPPAEVLAFHRSLPDYAPTALVDAPAIAALLGVSRVLVKDESSRLGLPAFKALGASWAMHRALAAMQPAPTLPVTFVTATDGNHGRAVARMARRLGHAALIVVPDGVHPVAVEAIRGEGAPVLHAGGSYDDAVAMAAAEAVRTGGILLQDTAWPGYEDVPAWIVEGYATLFAEADAQMAALGLGAPDLAVVPAGVGSLAQACVAFYRSRPDPARTAVLSVEPVVAACILASLAAGHAVSVPTSVTAMAGLNCGTPSSLAWPVLAAGLDAAVAVTDAEAGAAAPLLRAASVDAGPCGCAPLAGAIVALTGDGSAERRAQLGVGAASTILLVATEGAAANPG